MVCVFGGLVPLKHGAPGIGKMKFNRSTGIEIVSGFRSRKAFGWVIMCAFLRRLLSDGRHGAKYPAGRVVVSEANTLLHSFYRSQRFGLAWGFLVLQYTGIL